jgi:hypothetical protein
MAFLCSVLKGEDRPSFGRRKAEARAVLDLRLADETAVE